MATSEIRVSGPDAVRLATRLLQRIRLADATAGLWEAADIQWWWRSPRSSDRIDQVFWLDAEQPVAAALLTEFRGAWQLDPLIVPGAGGIGLSEVWARGLAAVDELRVAPVSTLIRDDDTALAALALATGFRPSGDRGGITWMCGLDRPAPRPAPPGFHLVDRTERSGRPHPMRRRNGDEVEMRLRQCSLYDPWLDLAIEADDGDVAGYALFWYDPVTDVGLVEPMRVEDAYQRRGLARAMLTAGLERLAVRGARRFKVGYGTDAARALYEGAGFHTSHTDTEYERAEVGPARGVMA